MPLKDPDARKAYEYARARDPKRVSYRRKNRELPPFIGVDGEGGTLPDGTRQEYLLLRAGERVIENPAGLSPFECFRFLADLATDNVIYVSYFFDYDVTMMCRDLPPDRVKRLLNRSARINPLTGRANGVGVYNDAFEIDYMQSKEFAVRRPGQKWVVIHDTGSFFQQSFVKSLRDWFGYWDDAEPAVWHPNPGEEEYSPVIDAIAEGKEQRNSFGEVDDYERRYNLWEVRMLARMMSKFRHTLIECDIPMPKKWQGPGNIAAVLFNKHGFPKRATHGKEPVPGKHLMIAQKYPDVVQMANDAYYGGRFEPVRMGYVAGPVYQYDINSAYAAMYQQLPCLLHGQWRRVNAGRDVSPTGIYFGEISYRARYDSIDNMPFLGPFPCRTNKGTIQFPLQGRGIYTSPEIQAASNWRGAWEIEWHGGWRYVEKCTCQPFDFVPELYRQRKDKSQPMRARIFKLALASMYGKLAQSVGDPVYSNPVWASLITGTVRAQLWEAAMSTYRRGFETVMLATDGIFTREKLDLPLGGQLGEWDYKEHPEMFVVQSGVYFAGDEKPKTRGVPMKLLNGVREDLRQRWTHYMETGVFDADWDSLTYVERRTFTGLKMAHHLGKPEKAGTWEDELRAVNFNWMTKRWAGQFARDQSFVTMPPRYSEPSVYYRKDIGGMVADSVIGMSDIVENDQPDWVDDF